MGAMASQITSLMIVYSTVYSGADKKTSKLCVTGICVGNSPVTGEFSAQMARNAENIFIWRRHHVEFNVLCCSNGENGMKWKCLFISLMKIPMSKGLHYFHYFPCQDVVAYNCNIIITYFSLSIIRSWHRDTHILPKYWIRPTDKQILREL